MKPVVIDARAVFAEKRQRAELLRNDPFALFAGMAYAAPVSAALWAMILGSIVWAV